MSPEIRGQVNGPNVGDEPKVTGKRHTVLRVDSGATLSLTFIPPFPTYEPETSWMRALKTEVPELVLFGQGSSRIAFLPAVVDRRYAKEQLPGHGVYWRTSCGGLVVPAFRCRWKGQA